MRVGYFGGTFDPPHCGHLAVAQEARARVSLDRVLLTPTGKQPLKAEPAEASFVDRLAMVELLCGGEAALETSDMEALTPKQSGPNYTVDTLRGLRSSLAADDELFVIVGADSFLSLRSWQEPDELLRLAKWIVVSRPGFLLGSLDALRLDDDQRSRVHVLGDVAVPVSATEVRRRLHGGETCEGLVPNSVLEYIAEHGLYKEFQTTPRGLR